MALLEVTCKGGSAMKLWLLGLFLLAAVLLAGEAAAADAHYVGSGTCSSCHSEEYKNFSTYAKKSHSYEHLKKLAGGLTQSELQDCYHCHTTGYGKPGGFESVEKTPELQNAGCEVCHGPGSAHAGSGKKADINGHPTRQVCDTCHTSSRVQAFNYRPLVYGGAH
jgi:hypothetical protein